MTAVLRILPTPDDVARAGADEFIAAATAAIGQRGVFRVCLAGGSTPRAMYALLREVPVGRVDWSRVHVFFGDERCVPPDHRDSNAGLAQRELLDHVPVDPRNVFPMDGGREPEEAADRYEQVLAEQLGGDGRMDLVYLGLGADGHTASLFPGADALAERTRRCVAGYVAAMSAWRLTLTFPAINASRHVVFLVAGAAKRDALCAVRCEPVDVMQRPAQGVSPTHGSVVFLADDEAARGRRRPEE